MDKVKAAKDKFQKIYQRFTTKDDMFAVGIGKDSEGNYTIEVRLSNEKLLSVLPKYFENFAVNSVIVGHIKAL